MTELLVKKNSKWVFILSGLFILLNCFAIANEFYLLSALPFILLIVYLALFKLDVLFYLVVFSVPLSVSLEKLDFGGIGVILPTEPILFGMLLVFLLKVLMEGFDKEFIFHPLTLLIIAQIVWISVTSLTSELPIVSIKFLISRLWFVATFFFIASRIVKDPKSINKFFWMYIIPLGIVVLYTLIRHSFRAFAEKPGHWVMEPFFKDHTSYGAILAMIFPFLIWKSIGDKGTGLSKVLYFSVLLFFTVGIVFSYTRAAWVSLICAFLVYLVFRLKIKSWFIWTLSLGVVSGLLLFQTQIFQKLAKNKQDSSSDFNEHVQSISNVSSDASNLERFNRWNSAFKMFMEKPIQGKGPGTYAFLYAPYQHSKDKTIISTNAGDMGNAHSEYFGPLAEMGLLGMLFMLGIIVLVVKISCRLNKHLTEPTERGLFLAAYLGLITYFVHGSLNNFLDTDKASALFWVFITILIVMDIRLTKSQKEIDKGLIA